MINGERKYLTITETKNVPNTVHIDDIVKGDKTLLFADLKVDEGITITMIVPDQFRNLPVGAIITFVVESNGWASINCVEITKEQAVNFMAETIA